MGIIVGKVCWIKTQLLFIHEVVIIINDINIVLLALLLSKAVDPERPL
jgi:hypothetical protein